MDAEQEQEIISFFQKAIHEHVKDMDVEDIKCIDWFVLDAAPHIEEKNRKVA